MLKLLVSCAFLVALGSVVAKECDKDEMCPIPYTRRMQRQILNYHNAARSKANPTATNMQKIYWDETMAKMALEHSKKCVFEHDTGPERRFDGYISVGQNLFAGSLRPNATAPAIGWWSEIRWFTFGEKSEHQVGHYTQLMQGKAARVGCGGAYCPNSGLKYIVTCNYLRGQYNYKTPYKLGPACAACPGSCKDNLCDCKGKVCKNGGELDLSTCKCKCIGYARGDICQMFNCGRREPSYCKHYKQYCDLKYGFSFRSKCTGTCGICRYN